MSASEEAPPDPAPRCASVLAVHTPNYPRPIRLRAGERAVLGRADTQFPGWIWCTTSDGNAGWAPRAIFDVGEDGGATALRDYDATELSGEPGATVTVHEELAGWCWCETEDGRRGWLPRDFLRFE